MAEKTAEEFQKTLNIVQNKMLESRFTGLEGWPDAQPEPVLIEADGDPVQFYFTLEGQDYLLYQNPEGGFYMIPPEQARQLYNDFFRPINDQIENYVNPITGENQVGWSEEKVPWTPDGEVADFEAEEIWVHPETNERIAGPDSIDKLPLQALVKKDTVEVGDYLSREDNLYAQGYDYDYYKHSPLDDSRVVALRDAGSAWANEITTWDSFGIEISQAEFDKLPEGLVSTYESPPAPKPPEPEVTAQADRLPDYEDQPVDMDTPLEPDAGGHRNERMLEAVEEIRSRSPLDGPLEDEAPERPEMKPFKKPKRPPGDPNTEKLERTQERTPDASNFTPVMTLPEKMRREAADIEETLRALKVNPVTGRDGSTITVDLGLEGGGIHALVQTPEGEYDLLGTEDLLERLDELEILSDKAGKTRAYPELEQGIQEYSRGLSNLIGGMQHNIQNQNSDYDMSGRTPEEALEALEKEGVIDGPAPGNESQNLSVPDPEQQPVAPGLG